MTSTQTAEPHTKEQRKVLARLETRRDRIVKLDAQLQEQYVRRSGLMCAARRVDPPVPVADICELTGLTQAGYRYALRTWPCDADPDSVTGAKVRAEMAGCRVRIAALRADRETQYAGRRDDLLTIAALRPPVLVRDFCAAAGISEEMYRKIARG